jgi:hypothetical protein
MSRACDQEQRYTYGPCKTPKRKLQTSQTTATLPNQQASPETSEELGIAEDGARFDRYGFHVHLDFQSRTPEGT